MAEVRKDQTGKTRGEESREGENFRDPGLWTRESRGHLSRWTIQGKGMHKGRDMRAGNSQTGEKNWRRHHFDTYRRQAPAAAA